MWSLREGKGCPVRMHRHRRQAHQLRNQGCHHVVRCRLRDLQERLLRKYVRLDRCTCGLVHDSVPSHLRRLLVKVGKIAPPVTRHLSGKVGRLRAKGAEDHPEVRHLPEETEDKMKRLSESTRKKDQRSRVIHSECVGAVRSEAAIDSKAARLCTLVY